MDLRLTPFWIALTSTFRPNVRMICAEFGVSMGSTGLLTSYMKKGREKPTPLRNQTEA
jgi:hypothetical protein